MSKSDQKIFSRYFRQKGILYQPGFGIVFKSVNAGIILSQLLYWHGKGSKKPWTYKTIPDMEAETGLTLTQQKTAINILVKCGVVEVRLRGVPAKRHFRVDLAKLHEILPRLKKTCDLTYPNPPSYYVDNNASITKITRKTTTESDPMELDKNNYKNRLQEFHSNIGSHPP